MPSMLHHGQKNSRIEPSRWAGGVAPGYLWELDVGARARIERKGRPGGRRGGGAGERELKAREESKTRERGAPQASGKQRRAESKARARSEPPDLAHQVGRVAARATTPRRDDDDDATAERVERIVSAMPSEVRVTWLWGGNGSDRTGVGAAAGRRSSAFERPSRDDRGSQEQAVGSSKEGASLPPRFFVSLSRPRTSLARTHATHTQLQTQPNRSTSSPSLRAPPP